MSVTHLRFFLTVLEVEDEPPMLPETPEAKTQRSACPRLYVIYAQPGNGKRASLCTDYTFGLWDEGKLVPVTKAHFGMTDSTPAAASPYRRGEALARTCIAGELYPGAL